MNLQAKVEVRRLLALECIRLFGMGVNDQEEIVDHFGEPLKWAIRDSKNHEPWAFSITIAMSLAAKVRGSAEEIAKTLSLYLKAHFSGSWDFVNAKGYINAYFKPLCLGDYLEGKESLNWQALRALEGGDYAYYRLQVLRKALEARGLFFSEEVILKRTLKEHPLCVLFDYPEKSLVNWIEGIPQWEKWLGSIAEMTRLGHLRDLDNDMEEVLLVFVKACLN